MHGEGRPNRIFFVPDPTHYMYLRPPVGPWQRTTCTCALPSVPGNKNFELHGSTHCHSLPMCTGSGCGPFLFVVVVYYKFVGGRSLFLLNHQEGVITSDLTFGLTSHPAADAVVTNTVAQNDIGAEQDKMMQRFTCTMSSWLLGCDHCRRR